VKKVNKEGKKTSGVVKEKKGKESLHILRRKRATPEGSLSFGMGPRPKERGENRMRGQLPYRGPGIEEALIKHEKLETRIFFFLHLRMVKNTPKKKSKNFL